MTSSLNKRIKKRWLGLMGLSLIAAFALIATPLALVGPASAAGELLPNGDFEDGVITPATTDLTLDGVQTTETTYIIGNSTSVHTSWVVYGPHTGNYMMIVNSATDADKTVWGQTVTVESGKTYVWEAYVRSSYVTNPAQLVFTINGTQVATQTVTDTTNWTKVSGEWTATGTTSAVLRIVDTLHEQEGDDFAIDDISLTEKFVRSATITSPTAGQVVYGNVSLAATLNDKDGDDDVQWAVRRV